MTNEEFLKHLGIEFKIARVRKNLTREQLAKMTGLCAAAIGELERGQTDPHILTYKRLYDALEMDAKLFL
jgi:transcriptional regulator with XRE-family HTH domain